MAPFERIDQLMVEVHGKAGHIGTVCEEILELLHIEGDVIYDVEIPPMNVGVHPDMRSGVGIKAETMHKLAPTSYREVFGCRPAAMPSA